jgi:hypothetical protein
MWVLGLNLTLTSLEKGDFAGDVSNGVYSNRTILPMPELYYFLTCVSYRQQNLKFIAVKQIFKTSFYKFVQTIYLKSVMSNISIYNIETDLKKRLKDLNVKLNTHNCRDNI